MLLLLLKIAVITGVFTGATLASFVAMGCFTRYVFPQLSQLSIALQTLFQLFCGILTAALLYSCCVLLSVSGLALQLIIAVTLAISLFCARRELLRGCINADVRFAFFLQYCFCVFVIFTATLASGGSYITPGALMQFTGLPIDLLIPYNSARFFLEGIAFAAQDVVPTWSITDRGPLSSLVIAFFFSLFRINEFGEWLVPNPKSYSIAYLILVFLNTLAIPALYLVLVSFSRRTAVLALLLLLSSYFFFVNILFPWPKFFAAALFLFAIYLREQRLRFASGLMLGASLLAHDSLIFAIAVFLLFDCFRKFRIEDFSLRTIGRQLQLLLPIALAFSLIYLPWIFTKAIAAPSGGNRLLYLQILCDKSESVIMRPFTETLIEYLKNKPISELLGVRLGNLWYPFDISHPWQQIKQYWSAPLKLIRSISQLSFYQYIFAVGLPTFVAACLSLRKWRRIGNPTACFTSNFFLISVAAVIPAAIAFGCPLNTTAHVWAYPAILAASAAAAVVASRSYLATFMVIPIALLNNGLFLNAELYRKRLAPLVEVQAVTVQILIFCLCLLLLCGKFCQTVKENND